MSISIVKYTIPVTLAAVVIIAGVVASMFTATDVDELVATPTSLSVSETPKLVAPAVISFESLSVSVEEVPTDVVPITAPVEDSVAPVADATAPVVETAPTVNAETAPTTLTYSLRTAQPVEATTAVTFDGFTLSSAATVAEATAMRKAAQDNKDNFKAYASLGSSVSYEANGDGMYKALYNGFVIYGSVSLNASNVSETNAALDAIVTRAAAQANAPQAVIFDGVQLSSSATATERAEILKAAQDMKDNAASYAGLGSATSFTLNADGTYAYSYNSFVIYETFIMGDVRINETTTALDAIKGV